MNLLFDILNGLTSPRKKINLKELPSFGLFYNDDFRIVIKKADIEDIKEYESNFYKEDLSSVITKIKRVVRRNSFFSNNYSWIDLKSIDIIFLFLEIVNFTRDTPIKIDYFTNFGLFESIEFSPKTFNYFNYSKYMKFYDKETREFIINGFRYSLPSIGLENSLTNYLMTSMYDRKYDDYNYNFIFFTKNTNMLRSKDISNMLEVFNNDLSENDKRIVDDIIETFKPIQRYSLIIDDKVIEMNSKLDLEKIWK